MTREEIHAAQKPMVAASLAMSPDKTERHQCTAIRKSVTK